MTELAERNLPASLDADVATPSAPPGRRDRLGPARADVRHGRFVGWLRRLNAKAVLMVLDGSVLAVALALAAVVVSIVKHDTEPLGVLVLGLLTVPIWVAVLAANKGYQSRHVTRSFDEFRRLLRSTIGGTLAVSAAAFLFDVELSRLWVGLAFVFATALLTVERAVVRRGFQALRQRGFYLRPVIVVGGNVEGLALCHMLEDDKSLGYQVRGFVDDEGPGHDAIHPHHGPLEETLEAVRATGSTGVIIAATAMDLGTSNRLIRQLTDQGVHVELSSTLRDIAAHRLTVRPLGRFPVVYVEPVRRQGWRAAAKRALDISVATAGLVASAPVLAVTALAIKLDSKGPVLFRQQRVGRNGVPFDVLKFRSMVVDAEALLIDLRDRNEASGPLFKMKNDPRVTRVGRIIRKLSIDELPQLWNVLRGEMSMVGPRPALAREVALWGDDLHGRLRVKPGITGMWQVNGRSSSSFADYERLDLYYVDNWSLATDLAIIFKTIPTVLLRRGAY
jgi:exopolysaccharide biosynthesis polyprenyl glycosylphosphotransferase